jgi:hypothetical protein
MVAQQLPGKIAKRSSTQIKEWTGAKNSWSSCGDLWPAESCRRHFRPNPTRMSFGPHELQKTCCEDATEIQGNGWKFSLVSPYGIREKVDSHGQ